MSHGGQFPEERADGLTPSQAARRRRQANRKLGLQARRATNKAIDEIEKAEADARRDDLHAQALRDDRAWEVMKAAERNAVANGRWGSLGAALRGPRE